MRTTAGIGALMCGLAWASALGASQEWPASALALRTNGGVLRPGECVRLALVAMEDVSGPIRPRVSYGFDREVRIEDEDGKARTEVRPVSVQRDPGPAIEHLAAGTSLMLDDTFCVGQDSRPGPYAVTVDLTPGAAAAFQLTTCVAFYPPDRPATDKDGRCGYALRGVLRREGGGMLVFDAPGGSAVLSRLLLFRGERLERVIQDGLATVGEEELSVPAAAFDGLGPAPLDVVLHDQARHRSATLARVLPPRAP